MIIRFLFIVLSTITAQANESKLLERYLNSLNNVVTDFTQIDHFGKIQRGKFFLSRPGKMRWQYEVPKKILIIINNKTLIHYNESLDQLSYFKNKEDFLSLLMEKDIKLNQGEISLEKLIYKNDQIIAILAKKHYPGSISLIFKKKEIRLVGMEIADNNQHIKVDFDEFRPIHPNDRGLFNFTRPKVLK